MAETIEERLTEVWTRTDQIFGVLAPEAWLAQPIALRHPFIFYLGHLPAFSWNHVCARLLGRPSLNAVFDDLFSRGIDPDVDDPSRCHDHPDVPDRWPPVREVIQYRDRVRAAVLESVDTALDREPTDPMDAGGRIFSMIIEHEEMHQETLLYMMQRLAFPRKVRPAWLPPYAPAAGRPGGRVAVASGTAVLGAAIDELLFGWDNEFPRADMLVPAFHMDVTPVTNAQFLAFVEDGGYRRPDYWLADDWSWIGREAQRHPVVWERRDGKLLYRTMFDLLPLETVFDWPVYTSLAEARAYARWRGGRLPTEPEFHRAAYGTREGAARPVPWGTGATAERHGNFDFARWAPGPVGSHPDGASAWGVHDLVGDGWEWTAPAFAGFPGFEANLPDYPGYSADFFDGKHYVLKGASWATARGLVRPSFRNWFHARYPYVFAKFRCVSA